MRARLSHSPRDKINGILKALLSFILFYLMCDLKEKIKEGTSYFIFEETPRGGNILPQNYGHAHRNMTNCLNLGDVPETTFRRHSQIEFHNCQHFGQLYHVI